MYKGEQNGPLPDILRETITKAIPDAFHNSLVVPGLLYFKGIEDMPVLV